MKIGLTGSSGSGKSTASKFFEKNGFFIIDFDKISRDVYYKDGPCLKELINYFGNGIIDASGELKRKELGKIVFNNPQKLNKLNQIVRKYIIKEAKKVENKNKDKNIIYDAPLLFEANLNKNCDYVISIICNKEIQIQRIIKRDNIDRDLAIKRLQSQHPNNFYIEKSDFVIENNSTEEEYLKKLNEILKKIRCTDL